MCVQKFCFIILMNTFNSGYNILTYNLEDELNSILDENLDIAYKTNTQLQYQGKQIDNVEEKLINIEYFTSKGKDIINRMSSFFHRFRSTPIQVNTTIRESVIQMEELAATTLAATTPQGELAPTTPQGELAATTPQGELAPTTLAATTLAATTPFIKDESCLSKLNRLKKIGIQIGEELEEQNIKLDKMDINIDKNSSYLKKNTGKIDRLM